MCNDVSVDEDTVFALRRKCCICECNKVKVTAQKVTSLQVEVGYSNFFLVGYK